MQRSFEDADFKTFVLPINSPNARRLCGRLSTSGSALMSFTLRATRIELSAKRRAYQREIHPVIKPRENSFVFDVKNDPAIFMYLDPTVSPQKFENTLAHEMHHIGYGTSCPSKQTAAEREELPSNVQTALTWTGAFGEGFAMLAAAWRPGHSPTCRQQQRGTRPLGQGRGKLQ